MSNPLMEPEDQDAEDLGLLNDHIYEMFFAQNSLIDMDLRWNMFDMLDTADEGTREQLGAYAEMVENFLKYATDYPDRVKNALTLLKSGRKVGESG